MFERNTQCLRTVTAVALLLTSLNACRDREVMGLEPPSPGFSLSQAELMRLATEVRALAARNGITPFPKEPRVREDLAALGQMLLFDPILSGNRDISCMTCHHPRFATGDARSQAIGQGGSGLGPTRAHPTQAFIPRNAPPLFNLQLLRNLFWDGRVSVDDAGRAIMPPGAELTPQMQAVLEFGSLSAIGLLPVVSREEMRAASGDNELADIPDDDVPAIWTALMRRLGAIPQYREMFERAYPGTSFQDMTFAHASNAMASFLIKSFTFNNAPWDRFLGGDNRALTEEQLEGARKFMNAPCAQCHNGPGFSNDDFHNVALAQFGPGQGDGPSGTDDFGRMRVTGNPADIYKFRSTMLRNVELTAPYGHAGEFSDLASFIDHYSNSADKLRAYSPADIPEPLLRGTLLESNKEQIIANRDPRILPVSFDAEFTRQVTAFMLALTDKRARELARFTPRRVPSGLPVER